MENANKFVHRARELRGRQTHVEGLVWCQLRARRLRGAKFRRQYPVGPFIVDFCCPAAGLIVELDGGQHDAAFESDARRTDYLNDLGYKVLRFWNDEVVADIDAVLERIARELESIPSPRLRGEGEGEGAAISARSTPPSRSWRGCVAGRRRSRGGPRCGRQAIGAE